MSLIVDTLKVYTIVPSPQWASGGRVLGFSNGSDQP